MCWYETPAGIASGLEVSNIEHLHVVLNALKLATVQAEDGSKLFPFQSWQTGTVSKVGHVLFINPLKLAGHSKLKMYPSGHLIVLKYA